MNSVFSNVPFRLIVKGGVTSSTCCILSEWNKYLKLNTIIPYSYDVGFFLYQKKKVANKKY
jgi:hypothetical protein